MSQKRKKGQFLDRVLYFQGTRRDHILKFSPIEFIKYFFICLIFVLHFQSVPPPKKLQTSAEAE